MTKDELTKEHEIYTAWVAEWRFYIAAYFGGKRYRDGNYLLKHPLESPDNYDRRKKMAYYYNYCAPIVDIYNSILYHTEPERNFGSMKNDSAIKSFRADADFNGNSFKQFMREAQRFASVYGRISILVDKSDFEPATQAMAEELDIRPYLTIIPPENITNWNFIREINGRQVLGSVTIKEGESLYRVWTPYSWSLYSTKGNESTGGEMIPLATGDHDLGRVPIVQLYNKTTLDKMIGTSDLEDIAGTNRNIYYLCSDAHEVVENTAFPMLAVAEERGGDGEPKKVGPKNVQEFDPEAKDAKPFWLEANHTSLEAIEARIERNAKEIYKMANLAGIKTSDSVQPMSGIALAIENQQRDASLAEKAVNMEQAETQVLELVALWQGQEFDGSSKYKDNYDIKDMDTDIQNALSVLGQAEIQSRTMIRELHKKISRSLLPKVGDATQEKIADEIDKFTFEVRTGKKPNEAQTSLPK
jgi:hypothetical protein